MKLLTTIVLNFIFLTASFSQAQYEICNDAKHPNQIIIRGIINKYLLQNDSAYSKWYLNSIDTYIPDTAVLSAFERVKNKVHFIIFGGTWCEDTQFILPKFFKLLEKSGLSDNVYSFFAVNREKKSLGNITEAFNITNVPTIIVMKDGKEINRIVEYGKTGKWDKELAEILNLL